MADNRTKKGTFRKGTSGNPAGRPKTASTVDPSINPSGNSLDNQDTTPNKNKIIPPNNPGQNAPSPESSQPNESIGAAGTIVFNGFIVDEEYNQDLTYIKGLQMYDRMRKSDATVKEALNVVKLPILAANWRVQAASDSTKDQQIADFIEYNLFETMPFDVFLRQVLTMLEFGFSLFEIIYNVITFEGKKYLGLQELSWRKQSTIWQWALDDGSFGAKQFVPGGVDGGFKQIPGDKLVLFTNEREGNNYSGISILRSAYQHWYMKDAMYKISGIAAERNSIGVPLITTPLEAKPADLAIIRSLAQNYRANEGAYMEVPTGYSFEMVGGAKGVKMFDMIPFINHHDAKILSTVLAQFLTLGAADTGGSYGLSKDQSSLFIQSIQWVAKYIAEVINEQLIPKLVDLNFNGVESYPALAFERIGDDNLELYSTLLPALVTSGLLTPTPEDEEHMRKMIDFPDIPDSAFDDEEDVNLPSVDQNGDPVEPTTVVDPNNQNDPTNSNDTPVDPGETNPAGVDPKFASKQLVRNRALNKILRANERKQTRKADLAKLVASQRKAKDESKRS
jgi:phage gp29-like protein